MSTDPRPHHQLFQILSPKEQRTAVLRLLRSGLTPRDIAALTGVAAEIIQKITLAECEGGE